MLIYIAKPSRRRVYSSDPTVLSMGRYTAVTRENCALLRNLGTSYVAISHQDKPLMLLCSVVSATQHISAQV